MCKFGKQRINKKLVHSLGKGHLTSSIVIQLAYNLLYMNHIVIMLSPTHIGECHDTANHYERNP